MISGIRFFDLNYEKVVLPGGFSLIEVLISISIFTIALLAISVMLLNTIKGNTLSIHLTNASQLASRQIEEMMLMGYYDLRDIDRDATDGLDDHDPETADMSKLGIEAGGIGKHYDIYANVAEDYPVKKTKTIRVIVTWKHGGRDKHTKFDFVRTFDE